MRNVKYNTHMPLEKLQLDNIKYIYFVHCSLDGLFSNELMCAVVHLSLWGPL